MVATRLARPAVLISGSGLLASALRFRPGTDHLFLTDGTGTRYIDCADEPITYFSAFCADVRDRTETAMRQTHVWTVCRLALAAQSGAERVAFAGGMPV